MFVANFMTTRLKLVPVAMTGSVQAIGILAFHPKICGFDFAYLHDHILQLEAFVSHSLLRQMMYIVSVSGRESKNYQNWNHLVIRKFNVKTIFIVSFDAHWFLNSTRTY